MLRCFSLQSAGKKAIVPGVKKDINPLDIFKIIVYYSNSAL